MRKLSNGEFKKIRARIQSRFAGMKDVKIQKINVKGIRIVDALHDAGRTASIAFDEPTDDVLGTEPESVPMVEPEAECTEDKAARFVERVVNRGR